MQRNKNFISNVNLFRLMYNPIEYNYGYLMFKSYLQYHLIQILE